MAKLSDKDKKKIIYYRSNGMIYKQIAEKYHVSITTIKRVCSSDPETEKKIKEKKEQNTRDMLAFLDSQKNRVQTLIEHIIEALDDPEKLARTNARDLATALGIIIDKFTENTPKAAAAQADDGFLKALQKSAAEDWKDGK